MMEAHKKNRLKEIRTSEGLTIAELAGKGGVSEKTDRIAEDGDSAVKDVTKHKIVNGLNQNPDRTQHCQFEEIFPSR